MTIAHIFNGELGFDVRTKLNDVIDIANAAGGGGSTIITGSGPPAGGTGSIGNYYIDQDNNQIYGPKAAPGALGPGQTAIPPSTSPAGTGSGNYELASRVKALTAGQITTVRYYRPASTAQVARTVNVWSTGGTLLGTASTANDGGGSGWKQLTLPTPITMAVNDVVLVSYGTTSDYAQTGGPTYPISNGPDISIIGGAYTAPSGGGFPVNVQPNNFFVDVLFEAELPVWPLVLDGTTVAIGSEIFGSTAGSILFAGAAGVLAQDNANFFWNDTTNILTVGGHYNIGSSIAIFTIPNVSGNNWFEGAAGNLSVTGYGNFGTGDLSLSSTTNGFDNVALGSQSLRRMTTGYRNIAVGSGSLQYTVSDNTNTAIGYNALASLGISGTGGGGNFNNIAIGYGTLSNVSIGVGNVAIGTAALANIYSSAGSFNTVIGDNAGNNLGVAAGSAVNYNTLIGKNAGYNLTGASLRNTWIGGFQGPSASPDSTIALSDGGGGFFLLDCHLTSGYVWSFNMAGNTVPACLHVYNMQSPAFTTTNYERAMVGWDINAGNYFRIGSERGGSGVKRIIVIDAFAKAGAPAASDVLAGCFAVIDDTSAGQTWLAFNKAGTIRKVQLT